MQTRRAHGTGRLPGRPSLPPATPALANQAMQAAKAATPTRSVPLPACDQPIKRFGDDNTSVTIPTTTIRTNKVERASRCTRARKPVRALPHCLCARYDYIVTPAGVLSAALLSLPLAATACPIGWTPCRRPTPLGARAVTSSLPSAQPRFSAAPTCAQSMGAYRAASARRRRMPS